MRKFRFIPWAQPVLKRNDDYGSVSSSSVNTSSNAHPWKASDGIKTGGSCSWESAQDSYPAWWKWDFGTTLKIEKLRLYNKYSSFSHLTKNIKVYADSSMNEVIAEGVFDESAFSMLEFTFDENIITETIIVLCVDAYEERNSYVGLGEIEIEASEGIEQFEVKYINYDGSILKHETVDIGGSVTPPNDPVREGYTFIEWSDQSTYVTEDKVILAKFKRNIVDDEQLLTELNALISDLLIPTETGNFKGEDAEYYAVLTPLTDSFGLFGDNKPTVEVQEVRISFFSKGNYIKNKNKIVDAILETDLTVTSRRYIGLEDDTGYHHYVIDIEKLYEKEY